MNNNMLYYYYCYKTLFFQISFSLTAKLKGKISFHNAPAHLTTCIASSTDHCPLLEWYLLQLTNFHGCIIQSAQFTLGFTLGVVPPLCCAEPLGPVQLFSVPWAVSPPGSSVHGDSPGNNARAGCHVPPPGDLPYPGIKPRSPALQADSTTEPPGKAQKYWSGQLIPSLGDHPNNPLGI